MQSRSRGREKNKMKRRHSIEFKSAAIEKHLLPGGPSMAELAKDLGVHAATIGIWKKKYSTIGSMSNENTKSKKKWSLEEKLLIVSETSSLSEKDLGVYLREKGLHSFELEEWRTVCTAAFKTAGRPKLDPETVALRKDKKELERNLRRKDKALAEMSARVILLKKSHEIFGVKEDDE